MSSTKNEVIFIRRQDEWDGDPETFEAETVLDYVRESGANGNTPSEVSERVLFRSNVVDSQSGEDTCAVCSRKRPDGHRNGVG